LFECFERTFHDKDDFRDAPANIKNEWMLNGSWRMISPHTV
jgi:hypothetical protein